MNQSVTPEIREVLEALHYRPAVSIIMPFEPRVCLKKELNHYLKVAADKVEKSLRDNYPEETCTLTMRRLRDIISNLNFDTHKKGIVIYVSLLFEKVIYLDIPVEEKIIIDDSFEIRDLLFANKQHNKFIVLLLNVKETRVYRGDQSELERVEFKEPASIYAYVNDTNERMSNFSDIDERKQITVYKFFFHIDSALDHILAIYPLPIFVVGAKKILGHFKKFTRHAGSITRYIPGNYEDATLPQLEEILKPHIAARFEAKQKDLLKQLEEAANHRRLAAGIKNVWQEAVNDKGRLLVVEKNYRYAGQQGANDDIIEEMTGIYNKLAFIWDAVDDVMEMVLANGGDVEFVDENVLKDYDHIALVQYY